MNCYMHPDRPAVSFCRDCGRPLCTSCQRVEAGTVYCPEHAPVTAGGFANGGFAGGGFAGSAGAGPYAEPNPYAQGQPRYSQTQYSQTAPVGVPVQTSPGLAFALGFIPGVGAIYNGQYIKGLVHAGIFGLVVSLISNSNGTAAPFLGILLSAFIFYMPFEAYHTARRRQMGLAVEEWSGLSRGGGSPLTGRTPIGPIVLISIGVLFLLDTMNLIEFRQIGRFWPLILIAVGASMLYSRVSHGPPPASGYSGQPPYPPAAGAPFGAQPPYAEPAPAPAGGPVNTAPGTVVETRHE